MESFKFDGVGKFGGGEYTTVTVDGVCSCNGDLKAESIHIDGVFKCEGEIETGVLHCDGKAKFKGSIKAKKIDIDGFIEVKNGGNIEADEIICDGYLKTSGEISADILNADGYIEAREIVGDKVVIKSHKGPVLELLNTFRHSKIDLIEATTIDLKGVKAKCVNGKDINIGPGCHIESIDCNGTLKIYPKAFVGKITGNYTNK